MGELDLAYFAGLFDGEGCIYINKKKGNGSANPEYTLVCTVSMNNRGVLEGLKLLFGGSIYKYPYHKEHNKYNKTCSWSVASRKAKDFLFTIKPFLRIKNPETDLALCFQAGKVLGGSGSPEKHWGRLPKTTEEVAKGEAQYIQMKQLKRYPLVSPPIHS